MKEEIKEWLLVIGLGLAFWASILAVLIFLTEHIGK
jgi:hypothetical protein